jgi:DNA-binding NarL/FixJ family response regulator
MRELILATLADQPDIEIVGEVVHEAEIPKRVLETLPDFLVIGLDEPGKRPEICDTILRAHPEVRILAVASNQNRSVSYWVSLDIRSADIEPSEKGFLSAVRSVAAGAGGIS